MFGAAELGVSEKRSSSILFIENGKSPDEPYNAALGFWLPPNSPYGNLQLKYMKIIQRLDEANRRIADSWRFWKMCKTNGLLPAGAYERHVFANEEAIYMLRRAADELVSLVWLLSKHESEKEYPLKIKIDCLGAVISQEESQRHEAFSSHINLIEALNNVANAFKHSFINSDHTLMGAEEPRVHALGLNRNKLGAEPIFYDYSLDELVQQYNAFYSSCISWLTAYSKRNR